jgi:hypothetical protein
MVNEQFAEIVRTVWAPVLNAQIEKELVSEVGVNHNYEGDVMQGGSVKITSVGYNALQTYDGKTGIKFDDIPIETVTLTTDHISSFGFAIDDLDKISIVNPQGIMNEMLKNEVYKVAQDVDSENFKEMISGAGNKLASTAVTTSEGAKKLIVEMNKVASNNGVPKAGRILFLPPDITALLNLDSTLALSNATNQEVLGNGYVTTLFGCKIYESANIPGTDSSSMILTRPEYTTEAQKLANVEATRLLCNGFFKDAFGGLYVSGRKVIRPEGIVVAPVTFDVAV